MTRNLKNRTGSIDCGAVYQKCVAEEAQKARAELRDRFAMAALTGMLAEGSHPFLDLAEEAYEYADAMLKARGQ